MTVRPPQGIPLPEIVTTANRLLIEEAAALRAALEEFANNPQPGCPWLRDDLVVSDHASPGAQGRATLLLHTRHQARLIHVNADDHLVTLGRVVGGDAAMPLRCLTTFGDQRWSTAGDKEASTCAALGPTQVVTHAVQIG
jgi:hypothetical protein